MKWNCHTLGKIAILVGVLLIVAGAVLNVCSMPIFSITRKEIHTQQVPKSEIIMNYFVSLNINNWGNQKVPFQCDSDQTLTILLTGDSPFDFSIMSHLSSGVDATYLSLKGISSVNTNWKPDTSGNYYLNFQSGGNDNVGGRVTKTWTEVESYTVNVTNTQSLIDPNFSYVGLGVLVAGVLIPLVTLVYMRRNRSTRNLLKETTKKEG